MKSFTVWLNRSGVILLIGGDPKNGKPPIITAKLEKPQIQVDPESGEIIILENK